MKDLIILMFINFWFAYGKVSGTRRWDGQLKWQSPTYERIACNCRSDTYRLMSKITMFVHVGSLISLLIEMILYSLGNTSIIYSVVGMLGFAYMLDWPVHVFLMFRANKRAKLWDEISHHKKKLTHKERRQVQEELDKRLKRSSIFKKAS